MNQDSPMLDASAQGRSLVASSRAAVQGGLPLRPEQR